jgi:hypothetical protein
MAKSWKILTQSYNDHCSFYIRPDWSMIGHRKNLVNQFQQVDCNWRYSQFQPRSSLALAHPCVQRLFLTALDLHGNFHSGISVISMYLPDGEKVFAGSAADGEPAK